MTTYIYTYADGVPETIIDILIDSPDPESPYYGNGVDNHPNWWDNNWILRVDGDVSGVPTEGQIWDFDTAAWSITKEALKQAVKEHRQDLENNTSIFYLGKTVPVSINKLGKFAALAISAMLQDKNDTTGVEFDDDKNAVEMTNEEFLGLVRESFNHFRSIVDADVKLVAQIDAETLTDTASIPSAFATAMTASYPHINPITDLYNTINNKVNKVTGKDLSTNDYTDAEKSKLSGIADRANHTGTQSISTVSGLQSALDSKQDNIEAGANIADALEFTDADLLTDYSPSSGYNTVINDGINNSNAAFNDLTAKHNDLVNKFNTLLANLEAQGLQTP